MAIHSIPDSGSLSRRETAHLPVNVHSSELTQKMQERKIFLSRLFSVSTKEAKGVLIDYLSGKEFTPIGKDQLFSWLAAFKLEDILKEFIAPRIIASPASSPDGSKWIKWMNGCFDAFLVARDQFCTGKILGTNNKLANALLGLVWFRMLDLPFSQEVMLRTPEKWPGERLERWVSSGENLSQPSTRQVMWNAEPSGLCIPQIEPMHVAGLSLQISCAHAQGDRPQQEDGHVIGKITLPRDELGFLASLDGHAGGEVTHFLETCLGEGIQQHFQLIDKPLKKLEKGEIENLLTTLFVRMQSMWVQKLPESERAHLLKALEGMITKLLLEASRRWESICASELNDFQLQPQDPEVQDMKTLITFTFNWIRAAFHGQFGLIEGDGAQKRSEAFECMLKLVADAIQKSQGDFFGRKLEAKQKICLEKVLQELETQLLYQKEHWVYDPAAVVALAAIIHEKCGPVLWTANVGDSTIIVIQDGKIYQVNELASPSSDRFRRSVEKRGGKIEQVHSELRVISETVCVNLTRTVGELKVPGLTPRAKVQRIPLHPPAIVILGTDGLFEGLTFPEVGSKCHELVGITSVNPAAELVRYGYRMGSSDNISAVVGVIQSNPEKVSS